MRVTERKSRLAVLFITLGKDDAVEVRSMDDQTEQRRHAVAGRD